MLQTLRGHEHVVETVAFGKRPVEMTSLVTAGAGDRSSLKESPVGNVTVTVLEFRLSCFVFLGGLQLLSLRITRSHCEIMGPIEGYLLNDIYCP